jgi:hypothetical protein
MVGEDGRMEAARDLPQLVEREAELVARAHEGLAHGRRIRVELALREPERQRERDQTLLRTVKLSL